MPGSIRPLTAQLGLAALIASGCLVARDAQDAGGLDGAGGSSGETDETGSPGDGGDDGNGDDGGSGPFADVPGSDCGPAEAIVDFVVDGDTFEIEGGERVRVLLVDTPEMGGWTPECYASEATAFTTQAIEGETVRLTYDVECRDKYDRLLAYVERTSDDGDLNRALVAYGYACVLHIQPNGNEYVDEFLDLQAQAQAEGAGMWGACSNPC